MNNAIAYIKHILMNPQARPIEVWLFRIAAVYVAAKLGVDLQHLAK